jgi:uncharacterized membrane protein YbhN (UPF0104 family)
MWKTLLKLIFTSAAFWLAFRNVAWADLRDAYENQKPVYLAAAAGIFILQNIFGGLRWHHIRCALSGSAHENPTRTTLVYYCSNFFNVCLPGTMGGDIARVWLARHLGGNAKENIYGVILDRAMSLVGLAIMVFTSLPWLFQYIGLDFNWGVLAAVALWTLMLMGYAILRLLLPRLQELLSFKFLNDVLAALQRVIDKYGALTASAFWSTVAHICYASAAYALARSLGMDISWGACLVLVPLVLFLSALPISFGGWGVREIGMTAVLGLAHISNAPALVLSVQMGLLSTFIGLFGGLVYLFLKQKDREVRDL